MLLKHKIRMAVHQLTLSNSPVQLWSRKPVVWPSLDSALYGKVSRHSDGPHAAGMCCVSGGGPTLYMSVHETSPTVTSSSRDCFCPHFIGKEAQAHLSDSQKLRGTIIFSM